MKVLNLQCVHQHEFEGWFGSEDDFLGQLERGLVTCPICGDAQIQKMLAAPRLNLRASHQDAPTASAQGQEAVAQRNPGGRSEIAAMQARVLKTLREVIANTEDVGERFADEARAMHHGEIAQRQIRGQTSPQEALALIEEGVEVIALPSIPATKETLQ